MKILIAEDDRITRLLLQKFLTAWGHEILMANDGVEAWEMFQEHEPPLVITDWNMPRRNGLELIQMIRRTPDCTCYVLMLTAHSDTEHLIQGIEAGADDFVAKPFHQGELRVRVRAGERIVQLEQRLLNQNRQLKLSNNRMVTDLQSAARVQHSLLPSSTCNTSTTSFAWDYQPSDELGGDMLNYFQLDDQHVGMYIADVSGHGVAASLLSVRIHQAMTPVNKESSFLFSRIDTPDGASYTVSDPCTVAAALEQRFPMSTSDLYFTLVYCILNIETGLMMYINAGHPPILFLSHTGETDFLRCNNPAVGWGLELAYEQQTKVIEPGDRVCLYSDGITEASNDNGEQFGEDQLAALVSTGANTSVVDTAKSIIPDVQNWCLPDKPVDDCCVLVMERTGKAIE